jgi:hypothetical protein
MGERDDHSRVAIWAESQRMDMLLTESRIFVCRRTPNQARADVPVTSFQNRNRLLRVVSNQGRRADGVEGGNAKQRFREPRRTAARAERI